MTKLTQGKTMPEIRLDCIKELGYALMYMDYIHPWKVEDGADFWAGQRERVTALCWQLHDNQDRGDVVWWEAFRREILDEIENMC